MNAPAQPKAGLDRWVPMPLVEDWEHGSYVEIVLHLVTYLEILVESASSAVAARAARMLLDHPPLRPRSLAAIRRRFPEAQS